VGSRTPASYLFYTPDQGTFCVYDAGDGALEFTAGQERAVKAADWCIVAVGPAEMTRRALDSLKPSTTLAWAVKQDAMAFPLELVDALFSRASVVSFSEGEREFLTADGRVPEERCRPGAIVLETRGANGVVVSRRRPEGETDRAEVSVQPVNDADTTGAGDTFIGTLVGLLAVAPLGHDAPFADVTEHVRAAARAATDMIFARTATAGGPPTSLASGASA
jgi:ribokinase